MIPKLFVFSTIFGFCIFTACFVNWKMPRKEQCGTKIICVFKDFFFFFFLHFHRLLCELENARVLYKIKRKFAFFSVNTKYISSRELKT